MANPRSTKKTQAPLIVALNKADLLTQEQVIEKVAFWEKELNPKNIFPEQTFSIV